MAGSRSSRHMLSSRMMQPGFSSPARTRPSSTCSLNATARSVSPPPLVTRLAPMRMRLPLAPAVLRAGGRISAGMISTVHTPLPMRAAMAPSDWPQRCAPSPESLMTSTMCSVSTTGSRARGGAFGRGAWRRRSWRCLVVLRVSATRRRTKLRSSARDAEQRAGEIAVRRGPAPDRPGRDRPSSPRRPAGPRPSPRSRWRRR